MVQGLIYAAPFYENSGTIINDLVKTQPSTLGTVNGTPTWAGSTFGSVLQFDGSTNYVSTSFPYTALGSTFTIAQWVNLSSVTAVQVLCGFDNAVLINVNASDFRWQQDENSFTRIVCSTTRTSSTWYLYAVTKKGTSAGDTKLYLNGLQSDDGAAVDNPTSGSIQIGRQQTGGIRFMSGQSSDVLVWNRVLAAAEMATLYSDSFQIYKKKTWSLKAAAATGTAIKSQAMKGWSWAV